MADPEGTEGGEGQSENWRRELERKSRERDQFEADLAKTQRELGLYRAGLGDLNDDQRAAVLAVAGDEADEGALKAKAQALGFVKDGTPPPEGTQQEQGNQAQQFLQNQAQAFDRLDDAASGVSAPPSPGNLQEKLAGAGNDQAKVLEILAQAGMLEQK